MVDIRSLSAFNCTMKSKGLSTKVTVTNSSAIKWNEKLITAIIAEKDIIKS